LNRALLSRMALVAIGGFAPAAFWVVTSSPPDAAERIPQFILAAVVVGTPMATAAALIIHRLRAAPVGRDWPERILDAATAGLTESGIEWGSAMRAELASIGSRPERRRFAIGCAVSAFRIRTRRWLRPVVVGSGVLFAVGTFAVSRASLAGDRGGIMGFTLLMPIVVLFALTFVTALITRSFFTGVVIGWIALLVGLAGMLVVSMLEASHWHDVAGVYLRDGDAPKAAIDRLDSVLDPVSPQFVVLHLLLWIPWTVLAAAAGSSRRIGKKMKLQPQPR
jgi:hypothetical protein